MSNSNDIQQSAKKSRKTSLFKSIPADQSCVESLFEIAAIYSTLRIKKEVPIFPLVSLCSSTYKTVFDETENFSEGV